MKKKIKKIKVQIEKGNTSPNKNWKKKSFLRPKRELSMGNAYKQSQPIPPKLGGLGLGCPTTYSCHVDSVLLNSKFEANRSEY